MSKGDRILVLCAMDSELRAIRRALSLKKTLIDGTRLFTGSIATRRVDAALIGVGPKRAEAATRELFQILGTSVRAVVVAGVSGGLDSSFGVGALFVPLEVRDFETDEVVTPKPYDLEAHGVLATCGELVTDKDRLDAQRDKGVGAVDMESYFVGKVCKERGMRFSIIRGISDHQDGNLIDDRIMSLLKPDGGVNIPALIKLVARHPFVVGYLAKIAKGFKKSLASMSKATIIECSAMAKNLDW